MTSRRLLPLVGGFTLREFLERQERLFLLCAMAGERNVQAAAARIGVDDSTFYRRLERLNIDSRYLPSWCMKRPLENYLLSVLRLPAELQSIEVEHSRYRRRARPAPASRNGPAPSHPEWALSKWIRMPPNNGKGTRAHLRAFGYGGKLPWKRFWEQSATELGYYYSDFKSHYRKLARQLHPDWGGTHADMTELNAAWRIVERRFDKAFAPLAGRV